jgi:hypothetical protein
MNETALFLGVGEAANRFYNIRRLLKVQRLSVVDFSAIVGIRLPTCYKLFATNPTQRISAERARIVEAAFGLPARSLDRGMDDGEFPELPKPAVIKVDDAAIAFLGNGVFLHRFININNFKLRYKLLHKDMFDVPGLMTSASIKRRIDPFPVSYISTQTARRLERRLKLKSGSLDMPCDDFDYSKLKALPAVEYGMLPVIGQGEAINRFVNFRRFMIKEGLGVNDVAERLCRSVGRTSQILSGNPVDVIGDRSARHLEKCFGLEAMSLDQPHTKI